MFSEIHKKKKERERERETTDQNEVYQQVMMRL